MPNWVFNKIEITGPQDELRRFESAISKDTYEGFRSLLRTFLPTPEELKPDEPVQLAPSMPENPELRAKYGASNWYEWRLNNWGCKWPDESVLIRENDEIVTLHFESPWAAPDAGVLKISELFPSLLWLHSVREEGGDFFGTRAVKDGLVVDEESRDGSVMGYDADDGDFIHICDQLRDSVVRRLDKKFSDALGLDVPGDPL